MIKTIEKKHTTKLKKLMDEEIFFYNGFFCPELVDLDDLVITSNYLGDITDLFMEELDFVLGVYSLDEIIEEQPFAIDFNIWISPSFSQMSEYNLMIGLDEGDWIEGCIE